MGVLRRLVIVVPAAIAFGAATVLVKMPARPAEIAALGEDVGKIELARVRLARIALDVAPDATVRALVRSTGHDAADVHRALSVIARRPVPPIPGRLGEARMLIGGLPPDG